MTKLKAITKEQLHKMIALLVAACIILPTLILSANAAPMLKAASVSHKSAEEVVTNKTATQNEDGTYHIKIDAYNNAYSLKTVPTDTVLVLERSSKMSDVLYTRDKTNLHTYTVFSGSKLESHNSMFDEKNSANEYGFLGLHFSINNTYAKNKYVLDPNTPETYLYLCQTYQTTGGLFSLKNHYTYSIVDTQGNQYESKEFTQNLSRTALEALTGGALAALDEITLTWKGNIYNPSATTYEDYVAQTGLSATKQSYTVNRVYTRDDDNATNQNLYYEYKMHGGLWIKDDEGVLCPVTIRRYDKNFNEITSYSAKYDKDFDTAYYVYSVTDSTGKEFTSTYGNPVYGGQYSVFQGFKTYDADGNVDHKNSIEHKTLYNGQGQNVTNLLAMQEGVEDFLLKVHKNAYDNGLTEGQQKVGVVSYASKSEWIYTDRLSKTEYGLTDVYSESEVYKMIKTAYAMEANGRRRIDVGMQFAKDMLDNKNLTSSNNLNTSTNPGSAADHKVNVVAFTTGMPSTDVDGAFDTSIANNAISEARAIERDYPMANIYTIGMYDLADESELHGDWFYRMSHANVPCDGSVGSYWGGTVLSSWTNYDINPTDAAATNRFLNYLSSNYRSATSVGLSGPKYIRPGFWSTGGTGYEVTANYERSDEGYYYGAQSTDDMIEAFDQIAESIQVPMSNLGEETKLVDTMSDYFNIVGSVNAYTMNYDGAGDLESDASWSIGSSLTPSVSSDGTTVTVTGFDYANNYCAPNHAGQKVVLEFDVAPIDGFLGGHDVPTNHGSSAIIDPNGTTVENLPYPTVNVPLNNELAVHDQYIYYTNEADLEKLFDVSPYAKGLTNDYASVVYQLIDPDAGDDSEPVLVYSVDAGAGTGVSSLEGETKGNQYPALEANKTYQVKVTVSTTDVNKSDRETLEDTKDATVYVYKPTVTWKDTTKNYADAVAGVDLNENRVSVEWTAEGTDHAAPTDNVPSLDYAFTDTTADPAAAVTDLTKYSMNGTTDFNADIIIKGHSFSYETELPYYVKTDGSTVLVSEYDGDKSDLAVTTYTVVDDDGNESTVTPTDDAGNPIYQMTTQLTTVNADKADVKDSDKHFATYVNETDNTKTKNGTEGNFTVYTGKAYDLYLSKIFSGPYAQPEGIVFTLTGSDGSAQTIEFNEDDFEGQNSGAKKAAAQLRTGITYTLVESFKNKDADPVRYDATATKQMDAGEVQELADMDETDDIANFQFSIGGDSDLEKLTVVVTNTDTQEAPPATGMSSRENNHSLLIAALATLVVLGGGSGLYLVWRKEEI